VVSPVESCGFYGGVDPPDVEVMNQDDDESPPADPGTPPPGPGTPPPDPGTPPPDPGTPPPPDPGTPPPEPGTAGITVTPTSDLRTTEAGGQATFTVVLTGAPTADVTIGLASNRPTEGVADVSSLTFTPANWDAPQTVTVTGVDDAIAGVDQPFIIVTGPAVSSDPRYAGLDAPDVRLMNEDDDEAGVIVTPTAGLVTSESGDAATFAIRLTSQPTANVTIPVATSRTDEGRLTTEGVTFTALDWLVPQTVTVVGVDDNPRDGNQPYEVITGPAISEDPEYAGLDAADVSVTNVDDEGR
jgi:hypothetical protein